MRLGWGMTLDQTQRDTRKAFLIYIKEVDTGLAGWVKVRMGVLTNHLW